MVLTKDLQTPSLHWDSLLFSLSPVSGGIQHSNGIFAGMETSLLYFSKMYRVSHSPWDAQWFQIAPYPVLLGWMPYRYRAVMGLPELQQHLRNPNHSFVTQRY